MKFRYYALWLSLICMIVFLLQILFKDFTAIFLLDQGHYLELWRFFTAIFLHVSFKHLLFNIFALALFGTFLEGLIGSKRFLLVFFITGILANLIAINFYESSLGASGAIFGVIGALIVVRPGLMVWAFGLPMPIFIAGMLWLIGDFIGLFVPSDVGNIAHLSGMFLGLILGIFYRKSGQEKREENRVVLDERSMREWEDRNLAST